MSRTQESRFFAACLLLAALCGCGRQSGAGAVREGMEAFRNNNLPRAIAAFTRASQRITDSPELYYNLGLAHLRLGNLDLAREAFLAATDLNPKHGESLACLGQIAYLQNDLLTAQTYLEQALTVIESPGSRARTLTALALTQASRAQHDMARLNLLRAQQADRHYAPAYYNLASLYRDTFLLREEALEQFELYVRLADAQDDRREKAQNNIKRLRLNIERTRAEELSQLRRDPAAAARLLQEGMRQQVARQFARAARAYQDALAADPLAFNAALGLAMSHRALGQQSEALAAFQRAADINPTHQDSHHQAAELALALKRPAEAGRILDRALARSPFNPINAELMARTRFAERKIAEARAYGEFYVSLLPPEDKNRSAYEAWLRNLPIR